jgi:hypothetical protein
MVLARHMTTQSATAAAAVVTASVGVVQVQLLQLVKLCKGRSCSRLADLRQSIQLLGRTVLCQTLL